MRLRTEKGEKVIIDFRSADVTHPILCVSGMSKRSIQAVLDHKYGLPTNALEAARLDVWRRFVLPPSKDGRTMMSMTVRSVMRDGDEDGVVEEAPEEAGVDDDEREDAMASEMRGSDVTHECHEEASPIDAHSISSMVRTKRARTRARPTTSTTRWGSARRDESFKQATAS